MTKEQWMHNLRVGDVVCDCRFRHLTIKSIQEDTVVKFPKLLRSIIFADWMPFIISNFLDDAWCYISRKLNNIEVADKTLILEGDSSCSAMHCCDPVPHTHEHPNETTTKELNE